jgi:hypothetical protein
VKLFKREKREKSSGKSGSAVPFEFSLMLPGRIRLAGKMVDVSLRGAAISFPCDKCPVFEPEERVRLRLGMKASGDAIMLDAWARDSSEDQNTRLYQFEFVDTTVLLRDLDPTLMDYFNRREAFRVRPDSLDPVDVTITKDDITISGPIMDISITGVALHVDRSAERELEGKDDVSLTIRLPDDNTRMEIIGKPAHVVRVERGARYGISFLWKETENAGLKERLISRYVMHRQMALSKTRMRA